MKKISYFLASMMLVGLAACSSDDNNLNPEPEVPEVPETPAEEPDTYMVPEVVVRGSSLELNANEVEASAQLQDFSLRLTKTLMQDPNNDNILISPISALFGLSLALNGAEGDTYAEMAKTLGFTNTQLYNINDLNYKLLKGLPMIDPAVEVSFANAVIARDYLPLRTAFQNRLANVYNAEMFTISKNANITNLVNDWAAEMTNGKISKLLDDQDRKDVVLAMLNATYFCGNWYTEFDPALTRENIFYSKNGERNNVQYMQSLEHSDYGKNDLFSVLTLDFGNAENVYHPFAMTFFLPEEGKDLSQVLDWLENHSLKEVDGLCDRITEVNVKLPKFEVQNNIDLVKILQKMGMNTSFNKGADFSGMAMTDNDLFISECLQSNKFGIDEVGAIGTSVSLFLRRVSGGHNEKPRFHATRPFLFMVREKGSNAILFMGCIRNL